MPFLINQTKELIAQIDDYLDTISEGAMVFAQGVADYMNGGQARAEQRYETLAALERQADELRRSVERQLYRHSLIPESRGDVLGLLENMDDVIDKAKHTLSVILVERPEILPEHIPDWIELAEISARTAEAVVLSARAFFRDPQSIGDHLHKVYFHEEEGDRRNMDLKRKIFASDIELACKMHLRYIAEHIDRVSDRAEGVADRLSIYAIKRSV